MIHMASVWVPFTSESKEAIADYDEIRKEMRLALQECGRKLGTYLRKRQKIRREGQRRDVFARYIGEVSRALHTINPDLDPAEIYEHLKAVADAKTQLADQQLDEEGRALRKRREPEDDSIVVDDSYLSEAADDEGPAGNGRHAPSRDEDDATLFEK
jgi:DNA topoisomerase-6 subunit B